VLFALGSVALASNEAGINIVINGKAVVFTDDSGSPFLDENGRTMVPLRVTMEAAGAVVGYDAENRTAIVITERGRSEVPIGTDYLYCNNIRKQNDTISTTRNGRTYLPIRAVLESAGFTMEWDGNTRTVHAYTFKADNYTLVPYSTGSLATLVERLLSGDVIYLRGQYYATPDFVKMLTNTQVHYTESDLNIAVYPQANRTDLADIEIKDVLKEWVSESDLFQKDISFDCMVAGPLVRKGFYTLGMTSHILHEMPSLPDNYSSAPVTGVFDGISIKIENGEKLFKQDDLVSHRVLSEPITEKVGIIP